MAYLDCNATTPVDGQVLRVMTPLFTEGFGNPSSGHTSGRVAAEVVEEARGKVAGAIGMGVSDVIFTSGATEANNLALKGLQRGLGRPITILAGATEHKSVLQTCSSLADGGSEFRTVPVHQDGTINIGAIESMMTNDVDVVSVMAANSETGVVHSVAEVAELAGTGRALTYENPIFFSVRLSVRGLHSMWRSPSSMAVTMSSCHVPPANPYCAGGLSSHRLMALQASASIFCFLRPRFLSTILRKSAFIMRSSQPRTVEYFCLVSLTADRMPIPSFRSRHTFRMIWGLPGRSFLRASAIRLRLTIPMNARPLGITPWRVPCRFL